MTVLSNGAVSVFLLSAVITLFIFRLWRILRVNLALPPGPWSPPVLGIMLRLKKAFHLVLTDLANEHGKIFSCKMGQQNLVVLSDPKLIRKALQSPEFSFRPKSELTSLLQGYGKNPKTLVSIHYSGLFWSNRYS
jgi:hypothetical protein